eukprot:6581443-Pyramimonas_sp.AAC.1
MEQEFKHGVAQIIREKFSFHTTLPHGLLAALGHICADVPIEVCQHRVKQCLAERDDAVRKGRGEKVHRVAQRLCVNGDVLQKELEEFAAGAPLGANITRELLPYTVGSSVSRRVEGTHSQ